MTVHLVTFSDSSMSRSAELCVESAKRHGVDTTAQWDQRSLELGGFYDGREQWKTARACGYWAWKPFIVDYHLRRMIDGMYLVYSDAGVEFIDNVSHIIDRMDQDIFLFGNMYEHAHWCKRDIVEAVMPNDRPWYVGRERKFPFTLPDVPWEFFGKQAQASVIFFRVNDKTRAFVKEWLDWCLTRVMPTGLGGFMECAASVTQEAFDKYEGRYLIDDSPSIIPNHPEFQENRHDQAILTTMAYRDGIPLHWWPAVYNNGAFIYPRGDYPDLGIPALFHHHRKRDNEWESAA